MGRIIYDAATTLNGWIADENHSLDWLFAVEGGAAPTPEQYPADAAVLVEGSHTYEWVLRNDPGPWSYTVPAWVMTSRVLDIPEGADVRLASGDVRTVYSRMVEAAGGRDLWVVGGGNLAGQFADAGLLDEIIVSIAPVTLGSGKPLLPRRLDLRLAETSRNRAFVCARYQVLGRLREDR